MELNTLCSVVFACDQHPSDFIISFFFLLAKLYGPNLKLELKLKRKKIVWNVTAIELKCMKKNVHETRASKQKKKNYKYTKHIYYIIINSSSCYLTSFFVISIDIIFLAFLSCIQFFVCCSLFLSLIEKIYIGIGHRQINSICNAHCKMHLNVCIFLVFIFIFLFSDLKKSRRCLFIGTLSLANKSKLRWQWAQAKKKTSNTDSKWNHRHWERI